MKENVLSMRYWKQRNIYCFCLDLQDQMPLRKRIVLQDVQDEGVASVSLMVSEGRRQNASKRS